MGGGLQVNDDGLKLLKNLRVLKMYFNENNEIHKNYITIDGIKHMKNNRDYHIVLSGNVRINASEIKKYMNPKFIYQSRVLDPGAWSAFTIDG
jgi:predicted small secreted protein